MKYLKPYNEIINKNSNKLNIQKGKIFFNEDWFKIGQGYELQDKCFELLEKYGKKTISKDWVVKPIQFQIPIKGYELSENIIKNSFFDIKPKKEYYIVISFISDDTYKNLLEIYLKSKFKIWMFIANSNLNEKYEKKIRDIILDVNLPFRLETNKMGLM